MLGTTGLKNLEISCVVGVYRHERQQPQPVFFDIELDYDLHAASRSDGLGDAIDYDGVATAVSDLVRRREFKLLETMAEEIAARLLSTLDRVQTVRVEIRKPLAVATASCAFVRVERRRP